MTKTGWLIMRNNKHVMMTLITLEQYLRDQLSKGRTFTLEEIIKQSEDKDLTITEASHDTQTTNMKANMQSNNRTVTNNDYTLSPKTMNTQQIDIPVANKVSGETTESPNKGREYNRCIAHKQCETNIQMSYRRIIRNQMDYHISHIEIIRNNTEMI